MKKKNNTGKKLTASIITVIILSLCLCFTTAAIVLATLKVENKLFQTGSIGINLNDGKPVIAEHEFLFEPGMTVEKNFFIENQSTCDVYYKLYFDNLSGVLADVLEITVNDGEKTLYQGTPAELNRTDVLAADDVLKLKEHRNLTVYFYFPEDAGNDVQELSLTFDLCADAVQTKNNPNKLFS